MSGILQTPHILPLRLTTLFILHHHAVINNYSPANGAKVAELAAGSDAPNRTCTFSFDPDRRAGSNYASAPLVYQLCIYIASSVTHSSSSQANLHLTMAGKVSFQMILFMQNLNDDVKDSLELDHQASNHDDLTTVKMILLQLHTMDDPEEVEKAKEVLKKATTRFKEIIGHERKFLLQFEEALSAPNHFSLATGAGLVYLYKWVLDDHFETHDLAHLLPHSHDLCSSCRKGLIAKRAIISSGDLDDLKELRVLEIALCEIEGPEGDVEVIASYGI